MDKEILLGLVLIIPELLLHSSSAMEERYLLPFVIGLFLFFVIFVSRKGFLSGKRRAVYWLALTALLLVSLRSVLIEADYFRFRGQGITTAMNRTLEIAQNTDGCVLSVLSVNNGEADMTIDPWFGLHDSSDDLFYWNSDTQKIIREYPFANGAENDPGVPITRINVIIAYNLEDRHYTTDCDYLKSSDVTKDFTPVKCGSLTLYIRNSILPEYGGKIDIKEPYY